jgi:NodT family efflux transporter outer membrane factor (OMF) lipoprotein
MNTPFTSSRNKFPANYQLACGACISALGSRWAYRDEPASSARPTNRWVCVLLAAISALLVSGCNFAPKYSRPPVVTPAAFKELTPEQARILEGWKTAEPSENSLRGNWWAAYGDAQLNALEEQVNLGNQTIAGALAKVSAARALTKQARSQLFPTVTTTPSVTRSRVSSSRNFPTPASSSFTTTEYALPFDASWEADLWGRVRNTVRANKLEAQATVADLENVRLTVRAEVAADYFQLRALDSQKELLEAAVRAYQESLDLTKVRHQTGIASDQDVAQAETQVNTTAAQATDVGIQRAQLEHALAMLTGKAPAEFSVAPESLKTRPVAIPISVPSRLLERRPDIAAAERRVAEANAQIGVARAAYFPTVTLSGSTGYQSVKLENLVNGSGFVWSIGAAAAQTIFDAGRRRGVTEQSLANYQGTVATYRQTVLTAFQEVEDNLSTLRLIAQELQQQDAAVESSQRYLTLAQDRYKLGIDSYLNVITAQTILLANQRTAVNLRLEQLTASIQLVKALGGGWSNESTS